MGTAQIAHRNTPGGKNRRRRKANGGAPSEASAVTAEGAVTTATAVELEDGMAPEDGGVVQAETAPVSAEPSENF